MQRSCCTAALLIGVLAGAAAAAPKPLPLSARVIRQGDFSDLRPESRTQSFRTAKAWVAFDSQLTPAQASTDTARLKREGFVAAVTEFLDRGSTRQRGVSWVLQLGSAAAARAELKADFAEFENLGGTFSAFAVPAIPGARGYRSVGGGFGGENVLFADGSFLYLVGQGWSSSEKPPTRAGLIAAVKKLYGRVHGR